VLIARFQDAAGPQYGLVEGDAIRVIEGCIFGEFAPSGRVLPLSSVRLLPPVVPSKVVAVGLNYLDHIKEHNSPVPSEPVLFLKSPGSIIGQRDAIVLPPTENLIEYEGELGLIIGKVARRVSREAAFDYILGCTCAGDITDRVLQKRDGQWARAKSFDTFAPLGPWIATDLNYADLALETRLNGMVRQRSRTSNMLFDVATLINVISTAMTLFPGDVIMTGTPSGVGALRGGDTLEITLEGVGTLKNPVVQS
jgi:2-keto-4-pentenoate hydratase/2-oxohepta-3-ene-1,7-dioic acid hydratase in catechol pathway